MKTSDSGLRFIAGWEGLRKQLYNDDWKPLATSKGHCTIGVGHLVHTGPCTYQDPREAPFYNGITDQQAIELMRTDVPRYEAVVNRNARVPLNQNQYDALVDFCFNTGGGYSAVWNAVNTGGDVCAVLMRTAISATGVVPDWATDALVRRRKAECKLFHTPYVKPVEPPIEEEDLAIELVWNPDFGRMYVLGLDVPVWVADQAGAAALKQAYGEPKRALAWAGLKALGAKVAP